MLGQEAHGQALRTCPVSLPRLRAECAAGKPEMNKLRASEAKLPIEVTGRKLADDEVD